MKKISCITLVAILVSLGTSRAGPVLLASLDETSGISSSGTGPPAEPRVQFVLELAPQPTVLGFRVGLGVFWEDGDTGAIDFTPETDNGFVGFAGFATNGIDDWLSDLIIFPDGGGGGGGAPESVRLLMTPDLVGYQLDFLRLIVHDLTIEEFSPVDRPDLQGIRVLANLTYEFYGALIPEPTTITVLATGLVFVSWRSKRSIISRDRKGLS